MPLGTSAPPGGAPSGNKEPGSFQKFVNWFASGSTTGSFHDTVQKKDNAASTVLDTRPGKAVMTALGVLPNIAISQLGGSDLDDPTAEKGSYRLGHSYGIGGEQTPGKIAANVGLSIALDPLTYLSGGQTAKAKAAATSLRTTEAGRALAATSKLRKFTEAESLAAKGEIMAARAGQEGAQFARPGIVGRLRGKEGLEAAVERQVDSLSQTGRGGLRLRIPVADKSVTVLKGSTAHAGGDLIRRLPGYEAVADTGTAIRRSFVSRTGTQEVAGKHAADALGEARFVGEARAEERFVGKNADAMKRYQSVPAEGRTAIAEYVESGTPLPLAHADLQDLADHFKGINRAAPQPVSKLRPVPRQAEVLDARVERLTARSEALAASHAERKAVQAEHLEETAADLLTRSKAAGPTAAAKLEDRAAQALSRSKALRATPPPDQVSDLLTRARTEADKAEMLRTTRSAQIEAQESKIVSSATPRLATPKAQSVLREMDTLGKLPEDMRPLLSPARGADVYKPELTRAQANEDLMQRLQEIDPKAAGKLDAVLEPDLAKALLSRDLRAERAGAQVEELEKWSSRIKAEDGSDLMYFGDKATAPEGMTAVQFGDHTVFADPQLAKDIEQTAKKVNSDEFVSRLKGNYDAILNEARAMNTVLPVSPAFFARNGTGNIILATLAGANPKDWLDAARALRKGATGELAEMAKLGRSNKILNFGAGEADLLSPELIQIDKAKGGVLRAPGKAYKGAKEAGRKVNAALENQARMAVFIHGLRETGDATQAGIMVRKYLFEYSDLTSFERNVMRRVVPFYTFARKNTDVILRTAMTDPGRLNAVNRIIGGVEEATGKQIDSPTYAAGDTLSAPLQPGAALNTLLPFGAGGALKNQLVGKSVPDTKNGGYRTIKPGEGSESRLDTLVSDLVPLYGKYGRTQRAGDLLGVTSDGEKRDLLKYLTGVGSTKKPTPAKGNTAALTRPKSRSGL